MAALRFAPWPQHLARGLWGMALRRAPRQLPVTLDQRHIYLLPTGFGCVLLAMLVVMLMAAINYRNNAAILLVSLLAAVCVGSLLQTFRNLHRVRLLGIHAAAAYAGDPLTLTCSWQAGRRARQALLLQAGAGRSGTALALGAADQAQSTLQLATTRRGWMPVPPLRISSSWPYGIIRATSFVHPAQRLLVYPRLEAGAPPPPGRIDTAAEGRRHNGGEEWYGVREYRPGDALRRVAWKASVRGSGLRVKTFTAGGTAAALDLDWRHTGLGPGEARISRLARWVVDAAASDRSWSLRLPTEYLPRASGSVHLYRCLRALAELPPC